MMAERRGAMRGDAAVRRAAPPVHCAGAGGRKHGAAAQAARRLAGAGGDAGCWTPSASRGAGPASCCHPPRSHRRLSLSPCPASTTSHDQPPRGCRQRRQAVQLRQRLDRPPQRKLVCRGRLRGVRAAQGACGRRWWCGRQTTMTELLVPWLCCPSLAPPCSLPGPPRAQAFPADTHALLQCPRARRGHQHPVDGPRRGVACAAQEAQVRQRARAEARADGASQWCACRVERLALTLGWSTDAARDGGELRPAIPV